MKDSRDAMIASFISAVENGVELMVVVSDSTSTSKIQPFAERFPERIVNVGIAEQNLVGMAAGLALGGYVVATANASPFLVNRSAEQVRNDVAYTDTNVKMMGLNPGFAYGSLGPTHHSLEDISMMRSLGGVKIYTPIDPEGTAEAVTHVLKSEGPAYIRIDSGLFQNIRRPDGVLRVTAPVRLSEGNDVTILGMGTSSHAVKEAAEILSRAGVHADAWGIPSIRPLRNEELLESIGNTGKVMSVEAHSVHGGLGSLVSEWIADKGIRARLVRLGVPEGLFAPASPRPAIEAAFNLDTDGIVKKVHEFLGASY